MTPREVGEMREHFWVIVLAGGEGNRIRPFTEDATGKSIPKQYCSLDGSRSMMRWALDRSLQLVPAERVVSVVAEQHQRWWEKELSGFPPENIVAQPQNRGTAVGVLLGILHVFLHRDPMARYLVLPSDHYVEDEETLRKAFVQAALEARKAHSRVMLLGMKPEEADSEYGWIVPSRNGNGGVLDVLRFREKPDVATARQLMRRGALVNALMLIASAGALLRLYRDAEPTLLEEFLALPRVREAWATYRLRALYSTLPTRDMSRDILERATDRLSVFPVPACGWSDLGTPDRLARFLQERPAHARGLVRAE
jgi:mannose-1-phosphate guanylyltransferase